MIYVSFDTQLTVAGLSGVCGARALLLVVTAPEHAPERATIPHLHTEAVNAMVNRAIQVFA